MFSEAPSLTEVIAAIVAINGVIGVPVAAMFRNWNKRRADDQAARDADRARLVAQVETLQIQLTAAMEQDRLKLPYWIKETTTGRVKFANAAAKRMLFAPAGCLAPEGKTFRDIFGDEIAAQVDALDAEAIRASMSAKAKMIRFPTLAEPMLVIKTIISDDQGDPLFQGFALAASSVLDLGR